jgi:tetratricopeptide (TPR) repeat protein
MAKSPFAPVASDASDGDLVTRGIEKAKNGDLDGAIADFDRAMKLNPKDDAPYYNRAQARRLKNDTAAQSPTTAKPSSLGPQTRPLTTIAVMPRQRPTTEMAQFRITHRR